METKDEFLDGRLDFQRVVLRQIWTCCSSLSLGEKENFINSVESFACLLAPYRDKRYNSKITQLRQKYREELARVEPNKRNKFYINVKFEYSKEKFEALIKLAERKGLLFKKLSIEDEEEEFFDEGEIE